MKKKFRCLPLGILKFLQGGLTASLAIALLALPVASIAQETTSEVRGNLTGPDGTPAAGVSVRITDTRTGRSNATTTSPSGRFVIGNLAVGGPYTIAISSENYADQRVTDIELSLGETFFLSLELGAAAMDEVVVTAAAVQAVQVAVGPSSTFNFDDIQNAPSINRDIKDIVRLDPRVYIDEPYRSGMQCVGANPRFNSLTVDGVKQNDNFGLNDNGYPTERMPFPFDAIQNVSLELSPYDVQYGGFTACNVNAVTRSGTNEFHGKVFWDYGDNDLVGDKLEGDKLPGGKFDENRYGVSFGGPIIEDTLFFFLAYEKWEGANTFDRCAGDQSCGNPVLGVSQAQLDRIRDIAINQYDFDPGETLSSLPNEDEKILARIDWNINDSHNASLTHVYNDGFNWEQSDTFSGAYEFSNHFYERGAELNSTTVQLFSDWTDTFSTELRVGFANLDNRQISRGQGFGEMQIETYFDGDGDGDLDRALVFLGGDDSRQSNDLEYDTFNFKLAANWAVGDHIISAGLEQEEIDIFNLFLQHTVGEYRFDENRTNNLGEPVGCANFGAWSPSGCIDQFEAFSPDDIYYGNAAPTLDPSNASAEFAYAVNTFYLQDEFTLGNGDLTMVAGLRYDWYSSDDLPRENSNFIARNGYSNRQNFDGESLLQPRFGFTWDATDTVSVRGGVGLYSGGNPNVWLGNNYQNDGFTQVQGREFNAGDEVEDLNVTAGAGLNTIPLGIDGNGRPGYDAPQALINYVANGTANSSVNAIDPNFRIPKNWKYSLGATWQFGDGYVLTGDVIFTRSEDSAIIVDDTLVQISSAPDGRPVYAQVDKSIPGCAEDPIGTGISSGDIDICDRLGTQDFILTNVKGADGEQFSLAATLSKDYDFGLSWVFGYAYTESKENSPMTSSVAFSNWNNISVDDPNAPTLATSNYEIPHRFILRLNYEKEFFGDLTTRFSLFGSARQGRPYSATFNDADMFLCGDAFNKNFGDCFDSDRYLLYMPTGPGDPNVIFDDGFDQEAFFAWAKKNGLNKYGGGIVPRNSIDGAWRSKFDLRISQELPGFAPEHRAQLYLTIRNLDNLINDDWGVIKERGFPRNANVVTASLPDFALDGTDDFSDDQYTFSQFSSQGMTRVAAPSLWSIRFGFNYSF
jgi:hypothetical protein